MYLPQAICLFLFLVGGLSAAGLPETTIWHLDQTHQIGQHPATVLGEPRTAEADGHKAVFFNGQDTGLILPVNPLAGRTEFTIEALIQPDTEGPAEQRFLHLQDEDGNRVLMEIRLTDTGWALDTFLLMPATNARLVLLDRTKLHPAGQWTWVALTYRDGHMSHAINGEPELTGDVKFGPMGPGQTSLGVRLNHVYWFKGGIREVRFHPAALAPDALQRVAH